MRALLTLTLTDAAGRPLAVRRARNAVMRPGADLVARLFAGRGAPVTHLAVGTSDAPEGEAYDTAALDPAGLDGETSAPLPAEAFVISADPDRHVVRVRVRGTLPDAAAVGTVREAGLLSRPEGAGDGSGDVLYNRVTFDPIEKADDHELMLFWEVAFPYGDLHYL